MLVLSRKKGERVVIGSNIEVTVLDVRGKTVRLGVCAPGDVPIHREELIRGLQEECSGLTFCTINEWKSSRKKRWQVN